MTVPTRVILDCDPGHDDMLAMMLAIARPEIELLGITTVAGNAALERVTDNALRILALLGRGDIPVAVGADRPSHGQLRTAAHVHGTSGLEGAELPDPVAQPSDVPAVEFMRDIVDAAIEPVTFVATGPLTNLAAFLAAHGELRPRVAQICLMGGAIAEGNVTPAAEFNIWVDPEAADVVLRSGIPITMVPLDVTHQAIVWEEDRARLSSGGRVSQVVASLLEYFQEFHERVYGWKGTPVHDAVAVAHLVLPGLVETKPCSVVVEVDGRYTRGRTVVDLHAVTSEPPNADVGTTIDRDAFVDLLFDCVQSFDRPADSGRDRI